LITKGIKSLAHRKLKHFDDSDDEEEDIKVKEHSYFKLPKEDTDNLDIYFVKKLSEIQNIIIQTKDEIEEIIEECDKSKNTDEIEHGRRIRFVTNDILKIFMKMYTDGEWNPSAYCKDCVLVAVSFRIQSKKPEYTINCRIVLPTEEVDDVAVFVKSCEEYKELRKLKFNLESKLLNKKYISYYWNDTKEIEDYYTVKPFARRFNEERRILGQTRISSMNRRQENSLWPFLYLSVTQRSGRYL
jgi:hypothetical protein